MSAVKDIVYIQQHARSKAALYEQLAEECAELGHAALKYARVLRKENPTPVTGAEALRRIVEEYSDLALVARMLGIVADDEIMCDKARRWAERIREVNGE